MPFVAIVIVLEEIIPLIVLYAPGMLPSTCILHSQRERIDRKRREKQRAFAEAMQEEFVTVTGKEVSKGDEKVGMVGLNQVKGELLALCGCVPLPCTVSVSLFSYGPHFTECYHYRLSALPLLAGLASSDI